MSAELISILVLVVVFVIATTRSINMGALAFAAAFGVGTLVAGFDADSIFAGFPGDLFVVLVGVTYLFAIARANGTTDWLVHAAIRLVRGRVALIPWVMFAITGVLTAIGAVSPAAVAIVAPIALSFAARYRISPLLMGAHGGARRPGAAASRRSASTARSSTASWTARSCRATRSPCSCASLVVNLIIAAVMFVVCGGLKLRTRPRHPRPAPAAPAPSPHRPTGASAGASGRPRGTALGLTPARIATLAALVALVVAVLVFDLDAGLTAITLAVVLSVVLAGGQQEGRQRDHLAHRAADLRRPHLRRRAGRDGHHRLGGRRPSATSASRCSPRCCSATSARIVSAFASSVGIMGALIPLAVPFLAQGDDRRGRHDRRARGVRDGRGRQPVLHQRRAGAGGRAQTSTATGSSGS